MAWFASFIRSFKYACQGIRTAFHEETNFMIEVIVAFGVLLSGFFIAYEPFEWLALLLTIGLVLVTELINTAIEATIDLYTDTYHPLAKKAKDVAAGAVLIAAILAILVACVIYGRRIFL